MARHAGFAVAASVSEAFVNQTLWLALAGLDPIKDSQLFPLPGQVPIVGGRLARAAGIALFDGRPRVTIEPNDTNTVTVAASAVAFVSGNPDASAPIDTDRVWKVRLTGTARVAVEVEVVPEGIFVRWLPAGSSLDRLDIVVLEGPPAAWLPPLLDSDAARDGLLRALRAAGPVRLTSRLFASSIQYAQAVDIRATGVAEWAVVDAKISRAAVRMNSGSIAVGIDLDGISSGTAADLIDLIEQPGDGVVYRWPITATTLPGDRPLLVGSTPKAGVGDVAVLFSADALASLVGTVSAQLAGTPLGSGATFGSVTLRPAVFDKPLRGPEWVLHADVVIHHEVAGTLTAHLDLQFFLVDHVEPSRDNPPATWQLCIANVDIDVPWWVDVAVSVAGILVIACIPALTPLVIVGTAATIGDIIPSAIANVESAGELAMKNGTAVARANTSTKLPRGGTLWQSVNRIVVGSDGVGFTISSVADVRWSPTTDLRQTAAIVARLDASSPAAFSVAVALATDLEFLAPDCTAEVVVSRASDGVELARSAGPFAAAHSVSFSHRTESAYLLDEVSVRARIWLSHGATSGLLFAADVTLPVTDVLDRRHPFVTWSPHWVHFAGPNGQAWHRLSKPTLHRTAVGARCRTVRQRSESGVQTLRWQYVDGVPFEWDELNEHRAEVCDFCFFGGPTRSAAFPREDWF